MPDIKFECPNCGQHISAEEEYAGMSAQCPTCSCSLTIPDVSHAANVNFDEVIMHVKIDSWDSILAQLKLIQSRNIKKLTIINEMNDSLSLERNEYYIATFDDNRNILTTLSTALTFKKVIEIFEEFYKTQTINRQKVRWKNTFETAETHDNPLSQYEQENISHLYSQTPMQKRSAAQASFSTNQDGHKKCRTCDGLGKTYTYGGREKICQACEGTGIIAKKQDKILNQPWEQFFSMDSKNLGCGGVIILLSPLLLFLLFGSIGSCTSSSSRSSSSEFVSNNKKEAEHIDPQDPISWRGEEEKLEQQSEYLRNAKYSCRRCGMKSDRPLNDGRIYGVNGVCMYCVEYLKSKK